MKDQGEPELIRMAIDGDQLALERLLLSYYDRLTQRIARRLPASLRPTVSEEDILQQTLIATCQELHAFEFRGKWSFYRWLCRIAEYRLQDEIKAHNAVKRGGGRIGAELNREDWSASADRLIELLASPRHTPSQSVARHEGVGAVQVGLATLREDYRRALQLRYGQGMPVAEVGKVMNRTPHAVHNLCYRGLKELEAAVGRSSQYLTRR